VTTKNIGRLAGLLFLLTGITGGWGYFYLRTSVMVQGDAAATVANIMASESLFRLAIVCTLISQVLLVFFGLTLFQLFKEVHRILAMVLLISILMTAAIAVVNQLNNFGVLLVLSGADYLKAFTAEQLKALAFLFMRLAGAGQGLLEIFWTPYFLAFGLLAIKSKYLPKVIGILLIVMSVTYALNIYTKFLIPTFHPLMFTRMAMGFGALGGLPMMLWLLIMGTRVEKSAKQAA
jgi:hypothetical protein